MFSCGAGCLVAAWVYTVQVNGVDLADATQDDVVQLLRRVETGSIVSLTISRQVPNADDGDHLVLSHVCIDQVVTTHVAFY